MAGSWKPDGQGNQHAGFSADSVDSFGFSGVICGDKHSGRHHLCGGRSPDESGLGGNIDEEK